VADRPTWHGMVAAIPTPGVEFPYPSSPRPADRFHTMDFDHWSSTSDAKQSRKKKVLELLGLAHIKFRIISNKSQRHIMEGGREFFSPTLLVEVEGSLLK
jgi:hypothetical protein